MNISIVKLKIFSFSILLLISCQRNSRGLNNYKLSFSNVLTVNAVPMLDSIQIRNLESAINSSDSFFLRLGVSLAKISDTFLVNKRRYKDFIIDNNDSNAFPLVISISKSSRILFLEIGKNSFKIPIYNGFAFCDISFDADFLIAKYNNDFILYR